MWSAVTVATERSGRRQIAIGERHTDEPVVTAVLTPREAAAVAMLLTGTHIELITTTGA